MKTLTFQVPEKFRVTEKIKIIYDQQGQPNEVLLPYDLFEQIVASLPVNLESTPIEHKYLASVKARSQRILGLHEGQGWISPDFDDPLPDSFWLRDIDLSVPYNL